MRNNLVAGSLLGGHVPPELVKKIFTKNPNKETLEMAKKVQDVAERICEIGAGKEASALATDVTKHCLENPAPENRQEDAKADLAAFSPGNRGKTYVIDVSITHTTGQSCRAKQLKHSMAVFNQDITAFCSMEEKPTNSFPSPQLQKVIDKKINTYALLTALMNVYFAANQAAQPAVSVPAVLTHQGEISPQLFRFIETCATMFKEQNRGKVNIDGLSLSQATARYRKAFKDDIIADLVKGWGNQLLATHARGSVDAISVPVH